MEANELRIGNLINIGSGIIGVTTLDVLQNIENGDYAEPIPLTEEWLISFGFGKDFSQDKNIEAIGWTKASWPGDVIYLNPMVQDGMFYLCLPYHDAPCFYVHQLQNLYFALTGEELTLAK